uniref:GAF domain-containing protein n=1 Tax=Chromera velia CCMP2878 TaxID=1169474 RepID=A0A0G4HXR1_9ALVE|eukprot:Cvel_9318.t1-p1 / transcript=Cvel_9318.t1 / gene=Cvel_9318 / organism=Chromera_velia_CCMP2878 / gene_product=Dual 3',5'-cyclic-AMP and -GMP phosphodiesterase, putative / transcript_product=Dual 3',5'-cyclic-AMP and -GMP phosphodiesterase, putative / location=Cvel_scaffold534:31409-34195(-) / protein_length=929 / sequence_SO=supercontig / SO=protein_coding / is_pseudo=false
MEESGHKASFSLPGGAQKQAGNTVRLLESRVQRMQETLEAKEGTLVAQKQIISQQGNQLGRLRDVVFLLRCQVADLTDLLTANYIEINNDLFSRFPKVDQTLEMSAAYADVDASQLAQKMANEDFEELLSSPKQKPSFNRNLTTKTVRTTPQPCAPPKGQKLKDARSRMGRASLGTGSGPKATRLFSRLALKQQGGAKQHMQQGDAHPHRGEPTSPRRESAPNEEKDEAEESLKLQLFEDGVEKNGGEAEEGGRGDHMPLSQMKEKNLKHEVLYAFDGRDILANTLQCQLQRSSASNMLDLLMGAAARDSFFMQAVQMTTEATVLFLVSKNLSFHNDLHRFIPQWLQIVVDCVECEKGTIFLYDEQRGDLFSRCITDNLAAPVRVKKNTGVVGSVFTSGQPVRLNDVYKDFRFSPTADFRSRFKTRSLLCVPLKMGDRVVGALQLVNKKNPSGFTLEDLSLLQRLAPLVVPAFTSPKLHRHIQQHSENEKRLLRQAISGTKERFLSPLVREVAAKSAELLESDRCTIFIHDPVRRTLFTHVSKASENVIIEIPDTKGIAGSVFTTGVLERVNDPYSDPRFEQRVDKETDFHTRSILCCPIKHAFKGTCLGVMQAVNKLGGGFSKLEERRMEMLTAIIATLLMTSDFLDEATVSAELNERVFQSLSVASLVASAQGFCMKINRDAADLFFLENTTQWVGRHLSELLGHSNPLLFEMWQETVKEECEVTQTLPIFPFYGEAEGVHRHARAMPVMGDGEVIGVVITLSEIAQTTNTSNAAAAAAHQTERNSLGAVGRGSVEENMMGGDFECEETDGMLGGKNMHPSSSGFLEPPIRHGHSRASISSEKGGGRLPAVVKDKSPKKKEEKSQSRRSSLQTFSQHGSEAASPRRGSNKGKLAEAREGLRKAAGFNPNPVRWSSDDDVEGDAGTDA